MIVLRTQRALLRELVLDDAAFLVELLNDPAWLRFIGDRLVRTLADARDYIDSGPRRSYAEHGYGLLAIEVGDAPVGLCGLVRRASLPGPDLGFALLERYRGHGYAREAARAVLEHAHKSLGMQRVLAISSPDNERSVRLLEELDFDYEGRCAAEDGSELLLFAWSPPPLPREARDPGPEAEYVCPACGEAIVVPIDVLAGAEQEYVEDCPVCCTPVVLSVHVEKDGLARLSAHRE